MEKLKSPSFWFIVFLELIALSFVIQAFGYKHEARVFPLIIGVPTALLGVLILIAEYKPEIIGRFNVGVKVKKSKSADDEGVQIQEDEVTGHQQHVRVLTMSAWLAGYFGVIFLIGFLPANFLLTAGYVKFQGKSSWIRAVLTGLILSGLIWFFFDYLMKAQMWQGILFGEFVPLL